MLRSFCGRIQWIQFKKSMNVGFLFLRFTKNRILFFFVVFVTLFFLGSRLDACIHTFLWYCIDEPHFAVLFSFFLNIEIYTYCLDWSEVIALFVMKYMVRNAFNRHFVLSHLPNIMIWRRPVSSVVLPEASSSNSILLEIFIDYKLVNLQLICIIMVSCLCSVFLVLYNF